MSTPISVESSGPHRTRATQAGGHVPGLAPGALLVTWPRLLQRAGIDVIPSARGADTGISAEGVEVRITAVVDDSRRAVAGCCFVAVRGGGQDGHRYIQQAIHAGASVVVVERDAEVPAGVVHVKVRDSRAALAKLAAAFSGLRGKGSSPMRLIGVTGTNGKTTVCWILRSILQAAGQRPALLGTVEYDLCGERRPAQLTTPGPIELARLLASARDQGADSCILEVSSHALDQRRTDGLSFSAGVFTNLSGDHLDYHGDMPAYQRAKRRLFECLGSNSVAVINNDDPSGWKMSDGIVAPVVLYSLQSVPRSPGKLRCQGLGSGPIRTAPISTAPVQYRARKEAAKRKRPCRQPADVTARIEASTSRGCHVVLRGRRFEVLVRSRMVGEHNVYNLLAAAATAEALGIDQNAIRDGIESLDVVPGRLQRIGEPDVQFSVFVDYAHTDDALKNALKALRPVTLGRLICVFGCGGDRDRSKRPRMAAVAGDLADHAVVTSDNPRTEDPTAIVEDIVAGFDRVRHGRPTVEVDRRKAIEAAVSMAESGDVILIAGKGHETYQLVGDRVLDFDDAVVVGQCLKRLRRHTMTGGAA